MVIVMMTTARVGMYVRLGIVRSELLFEGRGWAASGPGDQGIEN